MRAGDGWKGDDQQGGCRQDDEDAAHVRDLRISSQEGCATTPWQPGLAAVTMRAAACGAGSVDLRPNYGLPSVDLAARRA
jgi:hypothetical protein